MNIRKPGESKRTLLFGPILGGAAAMAVALALMAPWLIRMQGDPTRLFQAGSHFPPPARVASELKVFQSPGDGYDGQFYLYAACDPLLLYPFPKQSFDCPLMRYQRVGFLFWVWAFSAGKIALIPWVYIALEILSVGLLGWALATLAGGCQSPGDGGAGWILKLGAVGGWLSPLFLGILIGLLRMTLDGPQVALLCAALVFLERRQWTAHLICCFLAAMTKETATLAVAAWGVAVLARDRRVWPFAGYVITGILFLGWQFYLRSRLAALGVNMTLPFGENSAFPFKGMGARIWHLAHEDRGLLKKAAELMLLLGLLWAALAGLYCGARRWRQAPFLALPLMLYAAVILCLGVSWEEDWAYGRTALPLMIFCFLAAVRWRLRSLAIPVLIQFCYSVFFWLAKMGKA